MTAQRHAATGLHVIGYSRVSTSEQADEGFSLAAQRQAVTTAAAERGWTVEEASDPGCSGKIVNPSLRTALETLAAGRADALVVTRMDRLARSAVRALDVLAHDVGDAGVQS